LVQTPHSRLGGQGVSDSPQACGIAHASKTIALVCKVDPLLLFPIGHILVTIQDYLSREGRVGAETSFDSAQAFVTSDLRKRQAKGLIPTREIFDLTIAVISIDANLKLVGRNELQELRETVRPRLNYCLRTNWKTVD
jgi:hypothetical protein